MDTPRPNPPVRREADVWVKDAIAEIRAQFEELEAQRSDLDSQQARLQVVLEWFTSRVTTPAPSGRDPFNAAAGADTGEHHAGPSPTTVPDSSGRDSIPQRVLALANAAPEQIWTIREFTDQLLGEGAPRSNLETVRKSALRLVERGKLRRVDVKHFQAPREVGN